MLNTMKSYNEFCEVKFSKSEKYQKVFGYRGSMWLGSRLQSNAIFLVRFGLVN
jgi:hypothetical protein